MQNHMKISLNIQVEIMLELMMLISAQELLIMKIALYKVQDMVSE